MVGGEGDDAVGGRYGGLVRHRGEMWRCATNYPLLMLRNYLYATTNRRNRPRGNGTPLKGGSDDCGALGYRSYRIYCPAMTSTIEHGS